ncbi:MAG: 1-acyl-sn-glycerol-3-phosphate acyltransferase [Saprospiraceae bacterium]|nr:1-acyl-sn-glycerol-3-phosphate acyltransferase [Saprospiraceae bacterium]
MLYAFLKVLVGFVLKIFYRKIHVSGLENIDFSKPQLIASNHPSGFIEPLVMACYFPKSLHFLVRGDVFENPFLRPVLIATHQIPIYRFKDGFSKLRTNNQTVDASVDVLKKNNTLLIFAEGSTKSIRMLRPLQKGLSRIAFQAKDAYPDLPLEILPVGINFTEPTRFRSEVMLRVGQPITVDDYYSQKDEQNKENHDLLLNTTWNAMVKNVIHVADQDRIKTIEKILQLGRTIHPSPFYPVLDNNEKSLNSEIRIASIADNLGDSSFEILKNQINDFEKQLKKQTISFSDLKKSIPAFKDWLLLTLSFIPALFGLIFNFIPALGGYFFTKKNVKQKEFKSSILMVSSLLLFIIYYIILIILSAFGIIPWYLIISGFLAGLVFLFFKDKADHLYFKSDRSAFRKAKSDRDNFLKEWQFID